MKSKVHPRYKTKYRVANWAAYNRALVRRGDVTVWVSSEADRCLDARPERPAGRAAALLGSRHRDRPDPAAPLPSPAAPGRRVPARLFGMMRLDLSAPRLYDALPAQPASKALSAAGPARRRAPAIVLDSTGLSIVGAGEWAAAKHGGRGRRGWRKLHLGVDQCGVIRVHTLTEAAGDDATTALDLLTAVEGPLVRVTADAASDTVAVYETAGARGATVLIPPGQAQWPPLRWSRHRRPSGTSPPVHRPCGRRRSRQTRPRSAPGVVSGAGGPPPGSSCVAADVPAAWPRYTGAPPACG